MSSLNKLKTALRKCMCFSVMPVCKSSGIFILVSSAPSGLQSQLSARVCIHEACLPLFSLISKVNASLLFTEFVKATTLDRIQSGSSLRDWGGKVVGSVFKMQTKAPCVQHALHNTVEIFVTD